MIPAPLNVPVSDGETPNTRLHQALAEDRAAEAAEAAAFTTQLTNVNTHLQKLASGDQWTTVNIQLTTVATNLATVAAKLDGVAAIKTGLEDLGKIIRDGIKTQTAAVVGARLGGRPVAPLTDDQMVLLRAFGRWEDYFADKDPQPGNNKKLADLRKEKLYEQATAIIAALDNPVALDLWQSLTTPFSKDEEAVQRGAVSNRLHDLQFLRQITLLFSAAPDPGAAASAARPVSASGPNANAQTVTADPATTAV